MVMRENSSCPFVIGQSVVYRPSARGIASDVMSPLNEKLVSGHTYRVQRIEQDQYVVPEGYSHPGGGIHWSEFVAK
jgi:hypothetical protein